MAVPGFDGDFDDRKQNADGGEKTLGALPVLLVHFHAPLQLGDATAIAVAQYSVLVVPSLR
jgi:hypothetical protein